MKKHYVYTINYQGVVMYVGKTSDMANRKTMHRNQRGTFRSAIPVDADLSKIEFNVVAEFDNKEEALKYEDQLILQYNTMDNGWNKYRSGLIEATDKKTYNRDYMRDYYVAHREEKAAYYQYHKKERAAYMQNYMRDYRARKKAKAKASTS